MVEQNDFRKPAEQNRGARMVRDMEKMQRFHDAGATLNESADVDIGRIHQLHRQLIELTESLSSLDDLINEMLHVYLGPVPVMGLEAAMPSPPIEGAIPQMMCKIDRAAKLVRDLHDKTKKML